MAGHGTGRPMRFRCWRCRRRGVLGLGYVVILTGEYRRVRPDPHRGKAGTRNSTHERQYYCLSCDHVGWSRHAALDDNYPDGFALDLTP